MPTLSDIKKRIQTVKNTEKITRAMKMVSASKLRHAQEKVRASRPYSEKLHSIVARFSSILKKNNSLDHPLFTEKKNAQSIEIFILTSNRGLCGGFNSNIIKRSISFFNTLHGKLINLSTIGKKGHNAFKLKKRSIQNNFNTLIEKSTSTELDNVIKNMINRFKNKHTDAVYLIYTHFKSAIQQTITLKKILPISPISISNEKPLLDYEYEPNKNILLEKILPQYLKQILHQAILESRASEHGARMTAMENATRNAKEMIASLSLKYNRARQAAITKELMEIISGAEAIK